MHIDGLDFIAPSHSDAPFDEAQALGSVVWLWMHSPSLRDLQLHTLNALLMPAIKHRQFVLAAQGGRPVAYFSWANFNEEAEQRYLVNPAVCMREEDWSSGERMWALDWVAPFGHTLQFSRVLTRQLMSNRLWRALYHRSERGVRIKTFSGIGVRNEEAQAWFAAHPVVATKTP